MIPSHFMDPDGINGVGPAIDNLRERAKLLEQMVFFDPVTGLPNRSGLERQLSTFELNGDFHLALLQIKMTGYHNFYDSFGHEFTVSIVKEMIDRLNIKTPASDFIYRCSDDQVAVLFVGEKHCKAIHDFVTEIKSATEIPFQVGRLSVSLPCNMGIAVAHSIEEVPRLPIMARSACELAVQSSSPWQYFDNSLLANIRDEIIMQSDLRQAIAHNELSLVYQPKVCTGWVSPALFIPMAERYGMIRAIGQWVLEKSILQAAAWSAEGFQLRVSINLSAQQLETDEIFDTVKKCLAANDIDPKWICLEITESAAMMHPDRVLSILGALRSLGVELSIDDFGTGHSSLSYLYTLPVNELKLDRSFVIAMEKGSLPIIEASVRMANAFGMRVVAEGIETTEQRDKLIACGCNELQGYLFSKPLPPHLFTVFMETWDPSLACGFQSVGV
jgi:diguanylate cyclase